MDKGFFNRGYIVCAKLIPQPTWGGEYIAKQKGWEHHPSTQQKIGQSYELFSHSYLFMKENTDDPSFTPWIDVPPKNTLSLMSIAKKNPNKFLGKHRTLEDIILIKFTQAKGNSFQVHVRKKTRKWIPKPESWYFFEKGYATIGLSNPNHIDRYKSVCKSINTYMQNLSQKIAKGLLSVNEARKKARMYIRASNIYSFVNSIRIKKGSIVDLHTCGIHHSWEEDDKTLPFGNIVYELQKDVPDEVSSIRSFDKGKIKDDGSIREVHIEDYFKAVDTRKSKNIPSAYIKTVSDKDKKDKKITLFHTPYYMLDEIEIKGSILHKYTITNGTTYHHYFVKKGKIRYRDRNVTLFVTQGHSLFIPAGVTSYTIDSRENEAILLKTYLP